MAIGQVGPGERFLALRASSFLIEQVEFLHTFLLSPLD